jgi:hypothetical protein
MITVLLLVLGRFLAYATLWLLVNCRFKKIVCGNFTSMVLKKINVNISESSNNEDIHLAGSREFL